jgi:nitroimidazol reductase NimA-like FMN-containing flavoprotein (pyridoxamine 5'-phosphate oxidase superfamily)
VIDRRDGRIINVVHTAAVSTDAGFDVEAFLAQPLTARVAAAGPTVRPVWFLWEDGAFWWLTGGWARLVSNLKADPGVALVVDTCDLETGTVHQVTAVGEAEIYQLDAGRAHRLLQRYLGADASRWPQRFKSGTFDDPATRLIRLEPDRLRARDLSYDVL